MSAKPDVSEREKAAVVPKPAGPGEPFVARTVSAIPRSGIRDFFEIVQGMSEVISLGIGEPDFVTPWHIREAAIYALERGRTGYTSNLGLPRLRQAIAASVEKNFHAAYNPGAEILVTVGVSEAMDIGFRAALNPGDEVIYHEPCYVSYAPGIALAHGVAGAGGLPAGGGIFGDGGGHREGGDGPEQNAGVEFSDQPDRRDDEPAGVAEASPKWPGGTICW